MSRRAKILLALVIPTLAVAAWQWLRPYEWRADPDAPARIIEATLTRDQSYHWLSLRLDVTEPGRFEFAEGFELVTADDREIRPADLQLEGTGKVTPTPDGPHIEGLRGVAVKFWLEEGDLDGPVDLRLGTARLRVRGGDSPPTLAHGESKTFRDHRW